MDSNTVYSIQDGYRLWCRQDGTVPRLRCRQRAVSFSVSVTKLVLTTTLTLNDPRSLNYITKWHGHFKCTDTNGNGVILHFSTFYSTMVADRRIGRLQYGLKYTRRLSISTGDSTAHAYSEKDRNNYSWH